MEGEKTAVEEGYIIDNRDTKSLEVRIMQVARQIPDFVYLEDGDVQAVIATHEKKGGNTKDPYRAAHVIAECVSPRSVFRHIAGAQGYKLGPYVFVFYPPFFKKDPVEMTKVIIHELKHTKESKKGCRPHYGFGDSDVDATFNKYIGRDKLDVEVHRVE